MRKLLEREFTSFKQSLTQNGDLVPSIEEGIWYLKESLELLGLPALSYCILIMNRQRLEQCPLVPELLTRDYNQNYSVSQCFAGSDDSPLVANSTDPSNFYTWKYGEEGYMIELNLSSRESYDNSYPDFMDRYISMGTEAVKLKVNFVAASVSYIMAVSAKIWTGQPSNPIGKYLSLENEIRDIYIGFSDLQSDNQYISTDLFLNIVFYILFVYYFLDLFQLEGRESSNPLLISLLREISERKNATESNGNPPKNSEGLPEGTKKKRKKYYILTLTSGYIIIQKPTIFWLLTLTTLLLVRIELSLRLLYTDELQAIDLSTPHYLSFDGFLERNNVLVRFSCFVSILGSICFMRFLAQLNRMLRLYTLMMIKFVQSSLAMISIYFLIIACCTLLWTNAALANFIEKSNYLYMIYRFLQLSLEGGFHSELLHTETVKVDENGINLLNSLSFFAVLFPHLKSPLSSAQKLIFFVSYLSKMILNILISILTVDVSETREKLEFQRVEMLRAKKEMEAEKRRRSALQKKRRWRKSSFFQ